jgi:hypothetical protein
MMFARANFGIGNRGGGWRVPTSLLLALFFLYNPFITVGLCSVSSSVVQHPASYRSTVASSELGCATVQIQKTRLAPLKALVLAQRIALQPRQDIQPKPNDQLLFRAVTQNFVASLWFRPPPAL